MSCLASHIGFSLLLATVTETSLQNRIRWSWELPLWASLILAMLGAAWVASAYFREKSSAGKTLRAFLILLRLGAVALAVLMFAQPVLEWFRWTKPRLVILVDSSASMSTCDVVGAGGTVSRMAAWQAALAGGSSPLLAAWQDVYELDVVTFEQQFTRLPGDPRELFSRLQSCMVSQDPHAGTRLGDAVHYALRELPGLLPAAIVVFSDGVSTRGRPLREAAHRARGLRVPVFAVAVGSEQRQADIAVEDLLVEEIVFPGDRLQVGVTLRATGYAGQPVQVTLRQTGLGRVLAQTAVNLPPEGTPKTVGLAVRPDEPGVFPLEVVVSGPPGEVNLDNNMLRKSVEVRDEKIRVLLVQSRPSYEYRALSSLLARDPVVDLKVLLQEADPDFAEVEGTALRAFPADAAELFQYDVVLWGDVDPGALPRSVSPLLEQFVAEHGGGLACLAGPQFMPSAYRGNRSMELLLPVELGARNPLRWEATGAESYLIQPTQLGWQTPSLQLGRSYAESKAIWRGLPPVMWLLEFDRVKPGVQVLAEHPDLTSGKRLPIIMRHYVGAGEVLMHATDETWRWRWQTDDRYFARYWGQVVRRLGRGRLASGRQGVRLTAHRPRYQLGETVRLQVRFRDPARAPADDSGVVVRLQAAVGPPRELRLQRRLGRRGVFEAELSDLAAGDYHCLLARPDTGGPAPQTQFAIAVPERELVGAAADHAALRAAAGLTGGSFCRLARAGELAASLPRPQRMEPEEHPPQPLWNTHLVLALFVALLGGEWILRRRYGML